MVNYWFEQGFISISIGLDWFLLVLLRFCKVWDAKSCISFGFDWFLLVWGWFLLIFLWFCKVLGAKCCISLGFERFVMEKFGFMQVLKGF